MSKIFLFCLFFIGTLAKFPKDFKFGAATAAFQVEGAWLSDGKAPSVWDNLAHLPGYTADNQAPDIAADSYNRYKEDIDLLVAAGIKHYRMSISWPRIVPRGRAGKKVNQLAIKRYKEMFEYMKEKGVTPYVTLYHWDMPAVLQLQGYGFVDRYFVRDFLYYANISFHEFGTYVKHWFTFNEPWCICMLNDFKEREKAEKPYNISYHILVAHAKTVELYRQVYKEKDNGQIGIVFNMDMTYPKDPNNPKNVEAAYRALNFSLGWFADPIFFGDYPQIMRERVGNRLPTFSDEEKKLLKGSIDFFAFNHYTSWLYEDGNAKEQTDYYSDMNVTSSAKPEWNFTDMHWPIVPEGMHDLLVRINERYLKEIDMKIYITENGMANKEQTREKAMNDQPRINYMERYLQNVEKAINENIKVDGYFTWSLLDNFEWREGFTKKFGIVRVNFESNSTREPKASYYWYKKFIDKQKKEVEEVDE